ncbi:TIGR03621 family F420-dependent LLM class oxidoreductase [Nonomuraea turcica]|uniref:TIGR03621 family F420-dependent LLM class oxidoreductase n=1 Tax=Nonomuraea sp. G32 TaxID=3067274 RepID=UPI00273ABC50|nr:TIGR03621 family F420-dependent LLM class oxidoreductase [Nonomuraea sp. G32]MDP4511771.1 TIGR03621 family F420-dependent LLM class oxidoreductase [Nonomuraea sp. G32]
MPLPNSRPFRFGVALHVAATRREWVEKCRKAEAIGFDTIAVIDHLGKLAPFPALMLAAEVTDRVRLGTYVLDASYYTLALLARDIATTDLLIDGRLEVGIGAGRPSGTQEKLAALGLPYPTGAERVDKLEHLVSELRRLLSDPDTHPQPAQRSGPPLLIGGRGDRVLRLAAQQADIIAFTGAASSRYGNVGLPAFAGAEAVAQRVEFARAALGDRISEVEFNHEAPAVMVTGERRAALEQLQRFAPSLSMEERGQVPGFLVGTAEQIADKVRKNRERFGFSYITVLEGGVGGGMDAMAPVIELLRHQ